MTQSNQSRRSASAQSGMIAFLAVIIMGAIGWLLVWPEYGRVGEAQLMHDETQAKYDKKMQTSQDIDTLLKNYTSKREQLNVLDDAVPSAPKVPQLIGTLETYVRQSGMATSTMEIKITEIITAGAPPKTAPAAASQTPTPSVVKKPEKITLKIDLGATGGFENFRVFLRFLERNIRLFDIQTITAQSESSGQKFNLIIYAVYQK